MVNGWTILSFVHTDRLKYLIKCACGKERLVASNKIISLRPCLLCKNKNIRDALIDTKVGEFNIISSEKIGNRHMYLAECKCGDRRLMTYNSLKRRKVCQSCRFVNFSGKVVQGCKLIRRVSSHIWEIKCRCGTLYKNVIRVDKRTNEARFRDCGCTKNIAYKNAANKKIGNKFGNLKVIAVEKGFRHNMLVCKCICGNKIKIKNGHEPRQLSCGCARLTNKHNSERHARARFTNVEIISIRELSKSGLYTIQDLGLMFNVGPHYITRILKKQIWKHV